MPVAENMDLNYLCVLKCKLLENVLIEIECFEVH